MVQTATREDKRIKFSWRNPFYFHLFSTKHLDISTMAVPFFLVHLTPLLLFYIDFQSSYVWLCLGIYFWHMFGITGFYHRYFSHRGFKMGRVMQFIAAFWTMSTAQKGPLWWAGHHRYHHAKSDKEDDLHSPIQQGFWHSHVLWFLAEQSTDYEAKRIQDFAKYPELVFLDRYYYIAPVALAAGLYLAGGLPWLVWGFFIQTILCWHATFTINSLSHIFGKRRYQTTDTSRNNIWLAILTLGEGWHNNHHYHAGGSKAGFYWFEIDVTYYILWLMSKVGLVSDLKKPPKKVIEQGRINDALQKKARKWLPAYLRRGLTAAELKILMAAKLEQLVKDSDFHVKKPDIEDIKNLIANLQEKYGEVLTQYNFQLSALRA